MIRFVTALREEAQPLIQRLGLGAAIAHSPFPVFGAADRWLTISGVGKANAAAATMNLYHLTGAVPGVWINAGVAGHASLAAGELRAANRIVDAGSGLAAYPPQHLVPLSSASLITVDRPERDYPEQCLYDMEAAGFHATAARCSAAEAVQCFKVVSDNPARPVERIDAGFVVELMHHAGERICEAAAGIEADLHDYLAELQEPALVAQLLERAHFTVTQQRRLRRLAARWQALRADEAFDQYLPAQGLSANDILKTLECKLETLPGWYAQA